MTRPVEALPPRPTHRVRTALISAGLFAVTVATCLPAIGGVGVDVAALVRNWENGAAKLGQMLVPDLSFLPRTVVPMLQTLAMAVVGAVAAALLSVPLTLWAARTSNPHGPTRLAVRFLVNIIRAVPDLVYATILVAMVGVGALPGVLTLVLFDVGIVIKLVSEALDASEHPALEAGRAAGGTQTQINRAVVLPQAWPLFAAQWLYTLELNVRISAILGIVGAGGIGRLLDERRSFFAYDDVSLIILEILVVVILIEVVSVALRRRLR